MSFFFRKKSNNEAIEAQTKIINYLTENILIPFEKDKNFTWEYILKTDDQPWGIMKGFSKGYKRFFKDAFDIVYSFFGM